MGRKFTQEEWLEAITKVNPHVKVLGKIVNSKTPVLCRCDLCGCEWSPTPNDISRYQHKCGKNCNLTQEEVIAKFKEAHGDKYDYSKVEYKVANKNVTIICLKHGEFEQLPQDHWRGRGCPECRREMLAKFNEERRNSAAKEFEAKAKAKHMGKYDYSKVVYENRTKDVVIICPIHGEFKQKPCKHLDGHGCAECGRLESARKHRLCHDEQVAAIAKINPNIEILGRIINATTPVLCRCKVCNHKWEPLPSNLQCRTGCPKCADYGFLSHEHGNLYIMVDNLEVPTLMKIGVSVDVKRRRSTIFGSAKKAGVGINNLYVMKTWYGPTENMHALEKAMHQALSQYKINFPVKFDGCQEFFYYRPEVFELIEEHLKKLSKQ